MRTIEIEVIGGDPLYMPVKEVPASREALFNVIKTMEGVDLSNFSITNADGLTVTDDMLQAYTGSTNVSNIKLYAATTGKHGTFSQ